MKQPLPVQIAVDHSRRQFEKVNSSKHSLTIVIASFIAWIIFYYVESANSLDLFCNRRCLECSETRK